MRVLAVVPGPDANGVVLHALAVAAQVGADVQRTAAVPDPSYDVVHVPFTDALFGPDIGAAATAFETWAAGVVAPLVVTLHDVPGADGDRDRDARRRAGYRRVAAAADAVVVCSEQEADRLLPRPAVVPLPVAPLAGPAGAPAWADRPTVGVLGFVYPGKGHDRAVAAAAGTGAAVVALGAPSPGHAPLVATLQAQADAAGVELLVTGALDEAELHAAARAVTVPVAAYSTTGASGSLVTWVAAGRRPVTTRGPYADELDRRWPGALLVTDDLGAGVRRALTAPASTWVQGPVPVPDVVGLHRAVYASVREARR